MKYGTAIAITIAAVLGCSYVGSASAKDCADVGVEVTKKHYSWFSPDGQMSTAATLATSCMTAKQAAEAGISRTDFEAMLPSGDGSEPVIDAATAGFNMGSK